MVSIIIPCYNVSRFVPDTINSVLSQEDSDWEVLAVDDGSTDETLTILRAFANKDRRIRVYHQENKGVSSARNLGLEHAKGDWIYFLDGDDIIEKELVKLLNSQSEDKDMIVFDFLIEDQSEIKRIYRVSSVANSLSRFLTNKLTILMGSHAMRNRFVSNHQLRFVADTCYGEDREFIAKALSCKPNINNIPKILFRYRRRDGSAMTDRQYSYRRFTSILASERIYKHLMGRPEGIKAKAVLSYTIVRHMKMIMSSNPVDENLRIIVDGYIKKYVKGFHFYGLGLIELYVLMAGICAYNNVLFRWFLRLR